MREMLCKCKYIYICIFKVMLCMMHKWHKKWSRCFISFKNEGVFVEVLSLNALNFFLPKISLFSPSSSPVEVLSMAVPGGSTPSDCPETWARLPAALRVFNDCPGTNALANATGFGARAPDVPVTDFAVAGRSWKMMHKVHALAHIHTHTQTHTHIHTDTDTHTHTHIYIYIWICIHT